MPEEFQQCLYVGFAAFQFVKTHIHRYIGAYGGQSLGEKNHFGVFGHLPACRSLYFGGMLEHVLHRAPFGYKLCGSLLAHSRTAGDIVGGIAFQCEHVDYLPGRFYAIAFAYLLGSPDFKALTARGRAIHESVVVDQLTVVLVGCHHVGCESFGCGFPGESANYVVGLVAFHLYGRNAVSLQQALDPGHTHGNVLGLFVASGFVFRIFLMAESLASRRVETHSDIVGILFAQNLVESIAEAENGCSIESESAVSGRAHQGIICTINQRICVEQE